MKHLTRKSTHHINRRRIGAATCLGLLQLILFPITNQADQLPPAELAISVDRSGAHLELRGEAGRDYSIETTDDLAGNFWTSLFTFSLTGESASGIDPLANNAPRRFYRALTHDGPSPAARAENFRLIDQFGRSRELNYYWTDTNVSAVVLIFTANGCASVSNSVPALKALQNQFEPQRVRFWMINSQPKDTRSNIVQEASMLGLTLPILQDRAQLVARTYGATAAAEAFVVGRGEFPNDWIIVYRGALGYLTDALTAHLSGGTPVFKRTPAPGCIVPLSNGPPVSYLAEVAPLLQTKCVSCHSPGNIAPWAMTNHAIVGENRYAIRDAVLTGHMPPWHADPEYGHFANDNSLSPLEASMLVRWIDEGAMRGDGPDPLETAPVTSPADYPFTWPAELGEPDLVLSPPIQSIPATGVVDYRYHFVRPPFTSNVWLRAAVVLPSYQGVVHHISIYQGRVTDPMAESLALFVPGQRQIPYPAGTGKLMPAGIDLTFELHYTPNGVAGTDLPRLGLWLHTNQNPRALLIGAPTVSPDLNISPYQQDYSIEKQGTFARDVLVYGMNPHMHLRGARMDYEVIYPNGAHEILLNVPHYDFHWQTLYRLQEPKYLPAGTRLIVHGGYDNSPQNPHNPNPAATVVFGEQTTEEMFAEFLRYAEMLTLRSQPQSINVTRGGRASFNVDASSPTGPMTYQWQFNGRSLLGAVSTTLSLTNVQAGQDGLYTVVVSDVHDSVVSTPTRLRVGDPPTITLAPTAQTARAGGNATFNVTVSGTPPFGYQWRRASTTLTNIVSSELSSSFTLSNVSTNDADRYRVVVTNAFNMIPGVPSPLVSLTVTSP